MFVDPNRMRTALRALGELLSADGIGASILVVGGAGLNLRGMIERATTDVDVIARLETQSDGTSRLLNADPFPDALQRAIGRVARDLQLPANWMNHEVALQWKAGLPPDILADVVWETYSGLAIGLVGRRTQITLKFFAAVDRGVILTQDAGADFPRVVEETADHVTRHAR